VKHRPSTEATSADHNSIVEPPVPAVPRADASVGPLWLAKTAWAFVVIAQVVSLVVWWRTGFATPGYVFMFGPMALIALQASLLIQVTSGLILTTRRPENRVGWVILLFAVVTGAATPVMTATAAPAAGGSLAWPAWFVTWIVFPGASFLAFLLAFIFPTGRLASPQWAKPLGAIAVAVASAALLIAVRPGTLLFFPAIPNPIGLGASLEAAWVTVLVFALLGASGLVSGLALAGRYRGSTGTARVQIRWYVATGVLLAAAYVAEAMAILLIAPTDRLGEVVETIEFLVLGIPPIAITFAILRYRLYDIDLIISRAFVYGALTAVLAGIYTASIRLFNAAFVAATGETSDVALVITTLLLATTFTPVKRRLEQVAERQFGERSAEDRAPVTPLAAMPAAGLDDPAFIDLLDARIRAVLDERDATGSRRG